MSNIPENLRYTKEHEWTKLTAEVVTVGITDHAQCQLGDVVYLELPEVGTELENDKQFGVVESVKAVSDLFAPISGTVLEVNTALVEAPEQVNTSPYENGWMIRMKPSKPDELETLMDGKKYAQYLDESSHK